MGVNSAIDGGRPALMITSSKDDKEGRRGSGHRPMGAAHSGYEGNWDSQQDEEGRGAVPRK